MYNITGFEKTLGWMHVYNLYVNIFKLITSEGHPTTKLFNLSIKPLNTLKYTIKNQI